MPFLVTMSDATRARTTTAGPRPGKPAAKKSFWSAGKQKKQIENAVNQLKDVTNVAGREDDGIITRLYVLVMADETGVSVLSCGHCPCHLDISFSLLSLSAKRFRHSVFLLSLFLHTLSSLLSHTSTSPVSPFQGWDLQKNAKPSYEAWKRTQNKGKERNCRGCNRTRNMAESEGEGRTKRWQGNRTAPCAPVLVVFFATTLARAHAGVSSLLAPVLLV